MNKYEELTKSIVEALGGKSNIKGVSHCATRLRFTLVEKNLADKDALEAIPGVLGTQIAAGTYHVLIGTHVGDVYQTLIENTNIRGGGDVDEEAGDSKLEKVNLFDRFTRMMSAVYAPYIPILATGGIAGGVVSLFEKLGVVSAESLTYQTFYAIFYSLIFFFPILLAFTAAKHFKCNQYVSAVIGASLLYPGVSNLLATGADVSLLGIQFTAFNFASSFIPIILAVFCMSYVEKWLKNVLPQVIQFIVVPLICLVVFVPLTIMVFGPIGGLIANSISFAYTALIGVPFVFHVLMGAFFIIIIMFGLHWAVMPIMFGLLAEQGFEYGLASGGLGNYAVLGVCLAALVLSKNKDAKATAGSAAFVCALCGITEPGLYGIILKDKKYLLSLILGGAAGGLVCAIFDVYVINFAFAGILSFSAYLTTPHLAGYITAIFTSIIVAFVLTFLFEKIFKNEEI